MIVAIDGPAGAGKSSVARAAAQALGFAFVDTGALYRSVALAALERGIALDDGPALADLARSVGVATEADVVTLDGRDISARIREDDVTAAVSAVSAHPEVRHAMLGVQRRLASGEAIVEGRDIGSAVAPDAEIKVFLTAALEERARRRCRQRGLPEDEVTLASVAREVAARDAADSTRAASPLARAPDAIEIDTTEMTFTEAVDVIVRLVRERQHA